MQIAAAYKKAASTVVRVTLSEHQSYSGVIATADGYVVTFSALPKRQNITVHLAGGRRCKGTVLGANEQWGLTVLKIAHEGPLPHADLGKPAEPNGGDLCLGVGYPWMPKDNYDQEPHLRIVCVGGRPAPGLLWIDCRHEPRKHGDTVFEFGGAVFDLTGRLAGIVAGGRPTGLHVIVCVDRIRAVLDVIVAGKPTSPVSAPMACNGNQRLSSQTAWRRTPHPNASPRRRLPGRNPRVCVYHAKTIRNITGAG